MKAKTVLWIAAAAAAALVAFLFLPRLFHRAAAPASTPPASGSSGKKTILGKLTAGATPLAGATLGADSYVTEGLQFLGEFTV